MRVRWLADENVDQSIIAALRADGHVVDAVQEWAPGAPDDDVLARAVSQEAVVITSDKDFGELVFRQRRVSRGVPLLRLAGLPTAAKAALVRRLITEEATALDGAFTVVTPQVVRIRRG